MIFESTVASKRFAGGADVPSVINVLSFVHSVLLPHCSNDDDTAWDPVDKNELEHAEPAEPTSNNAIEQMVLDEEDSPPS